MSAFQAKILSARFFVTDKTRMMAKFDNKFTYCDMKKLSKKITTIAGFETTTK